MSLTPILRAISAVAAAAVLLGSGAAWATVRHYSGQVNHIDVFDAGREQPGANDPMNILLVGSDSRQGLTAQQRRELRTGPDVFGQRTDTMMLVHIGRDGSVNVVSIPRDSLVTVPEYTDPAGVSHDASEQKINAAYSFGGPSLLVKTIEQATGVTIDRYMEINFAGFVAMVDALGGVDVCSPIEINDAPSGLVLPTGRSTLNGARALAYVRAREFDPTADIGRVKRQQAFIASLVQKASSTQTMLSPNRLNSFVDAVLGSVAVDSGVDREEVFAIAQRLSHVDPSKVTFRTVPISGQRAVMGVGTGVDWDQAQAEALFNSMQNDTPVPDKPQVAKVEVAPSDIHVLLSGPDPQVTQAAKDLRSAGYTLLAEPTVTTADPAAASTSPASTSPASTAPTSTTPAGSGLSGSVAPSPDPSTSPTTSTPEADPGQTLVEFDPAYNVSVKTLKAALPEARFRKVPGLGSTFSITIGTGYAGVKPVAVADPTQPERARTAADDICG